MSTKNEDYFSIPTELHANICSRVIGNLRFSEALRDAAGKVKVAYLHKYHIAPWELRLIESLGKQI